jgi:hypothetical protein
MGGNPQKRWFQQKIPYAVFLRQLSYAAAVGSHLT